MTDLKIQRSPEHDVAESPDEMWAGLRVVRDERPTREWWRTFERLWNTQTGEHTIVGGVPKIRVADRVAAFVFHMNVAHWNGPWRDEHGEPCTVTQHYAPHLSRYVGYADSAYAKAQAETAAAQTKANAANHGLLEKLNAS